MSLKKILVSAAMIFASVALFAQEAAADTTNTTESVAAISETATDATAVAAEAATSVAEATKAEAAKMLDIVNQLKSYFTIGNIATWSVRILAILLFYIIYRIIRKFATKTASKSLQPNTVKIITKAISYCFYVLIVMYILNCFGIKLSAIWGAAGIAGVAIGFAAQTSVSNLISGLFVVTDKAMKVGDFIEVAGISGTVDSIGIISVKVKTLDKQIIRIPNSTIINSNLINYSVHNHRRYGFEFSIDYGSNLDKAMEALKSVPARCPTVITNEEAYQPAFAFTTLGDSGINMAIYVWCDRANFFQTKSDVCKNVVVAMNEFGINIPFNRMDVTLLNENTVPSISLKA